MNNPQELLPTFRPDLHGPTRDTRVRAPRVPMVPLAHVCADDAAYGCVEWFIYRKRHTDKEKP
jgi:hypothetical protein